MKNKTKLVSCKKLSTILNGLGIQKSPNALRASCEAFGKQVFCFLKMDNMAARRQLESNLEAAGVKVVKSYGIYDDGVVKIEQPVLEIQVSYFKAWHWDT